MNVLWLILDVTNVENLDLMIKLIFVQIVAIELQGLVQVMEVDNTHTWLRIVFCAVFETYGQVLLFIWIIFNLVYYIDYEWVNFPMNL